MAERGACSKDYGARTLTSIRFDLDLRWRSSRNNVDQNIGSILCCARYFRLEPASQLASLPGARGCGRVHGHIGHHAACLEKKKGWVQRLWGEMGRVVGLLGIVG